MLTHCPLRPDLSGNGRSGSCTARRRGFPSGRLVCSSETCCCCEPALSFVFS